MSRSGFIDHLVPYLVSEEEVSSGTPEHAGMTLPAVVIRLHEDETADLHVFAGNTIIPAFQSRAVYDGEVFHRSGWKPTQLAELPPVLAPALQVAPDPAHEFVHRPPPSPEPSPEPATKAGPFGISAPFVQLPPPAPTEAAKPAPFVPDPVPTTPEVPATPLSEPKLP